jgi:hypothetical protein
VEARQFGELEVVGSIPTTQTISFGSLAERLCNRLLSGEIQVQPLGDPPNVWAFGRTVMHLTLNQADVGSTPTAPTKDAPVTQLADVSGLKLESCEFDSRRGYSGNRARAARQSHKLRSVSATLTPASNCRCDVTGNMRLSYSLHAGSTPVACSNADVV